MERARRVDRGSSAARQDRAARSATDDRGHHLAPQQWGQVAGHSGRTRSLVDGRAVLQPLASSRRVGAVAGLGARAWGRGGARHDVPGRQHRPRPSVRGRCGQKGGSSAERDAREALGRSRGGYGTKAVALADGRGRAIAFALAPGQAHEAPLAPALLDALPDSPLWVVGDRGLSSHGLREQVWAIGAQPAIPAKRNEAPVRCLDFIYNNRNLIERLWGRLKEWRAVATRYEKLARSFMAVLYLAATMDWLKT